MIVLGIETSCDDTSASVYDGSHLLSNITSTQLVHRNFGGVVPELASRSHIKLIMPVIREALGQAKLDLKSIEGIAVTYGPGLAGSLLVGLSVAKGLCLGQQLPMTGINHLEGHIFANRLDYPELSPPFICLIASGGHTQIVHVSDWGQYHILGRTRDDAAGEAFDKVSKLLGLGYPGGPAIQEAAQSGNPDAVAFPRARLNDSLDFSFSGVKTAVLNHVQKIKSMTDEIKADIAASFQDAVVDVLIEKTTQAARETGLSQIAFSGGVAINTRLREKMNRAVQGQFQVFWPSPAFCSDNGAMIACAGHFYLSSGKQSYPDLSPKPSLNFS